MAAFAVACVDNPAARNQRIPIGGPAAHNWTEVVQAVGQAVGHPLPVNYVTPGSTVPLLPPMVGGILAGMETHKTHIDMSETAPRYGVELTPLEAFAQVGVAEFVGEAGEFILKRRKSAARFDPAASLYQHISIRLGMHAPGRAKDPLAHTMGFCFG